MAVRPTWKGYIKVSLVTIPVRVYPATESSATISFNQLHSECQTKIQQKKWCPKCEREITSAEVVKGKKVTSYVAIKDDLIHAGAQYVDEEVVRDGRLITSRKPDDIPAFCREIIKALRED